jgi:hypothetical protein
MVCVLLVEAGRGVAKIPQTNPLCASPTPHPGQVAYANLPTVELPPNGHSDQAVYQVRRVRAGGGAILLLCLGLAFYGFRTALAGQPVFGRAAVED